MNEKTRRRVGEFKSEAASIVGARSWAEEAMSRIDLALDTTLKKQITRIKKKVIKLKQHHLNYLQGTPSPSVKKNMMLRVNGALTKIDGANRNLDNSLELLHRAVMILRKAGF